MTSRCFPVIELHSYGGNHPPRGVDLAPAFGLFAFLLSFVPEVDVFFLRRMKKPIESMYGRFTYIWLFLMVKYGKCR